MKTRLLPLLLALALAPSAFAADSKKPVTSVNQWYKYQDDNGVTVISHDIPPAFVHKGYTIVDDHGKVVKVVARQLTTEEIAARDAKAATEKEQADAEKTRQRRDEELMKLYASPADVEAARDRKIASIENEIGRINGNIERLTLQKSRLEEQGAERERAGQPPSPEIVENLKILDAQIADREKEIAARHLEQDQQRANFEYDLERMRAMTGTPAPNASASSQSRGAHAATAN
jgi:hypothetical protein